MGHADKAFVVARYEGLAAAAAELARPDLSINPRIAAWERQIAKPALLHVKHQGAEIAVRMVCDDYDDTRGPRPTDWNLFEVQIDGVWFDAHETFLPAFIAKLEHAARVMPE